MSWIIRFIINAIVLWLIVEYVPGFVNGAGVPHAIPIWPTVIILAIIFGIVNALIGPILRLLSAPLTWITHGLFAVVINWILFAIAIWITPNLKGTWLATLIGAIILMVISTLVHNISEPRTATA
ncbi:MAG: phage holin family protein [Candidatus Eremiobacteraeota bacterium]|nr:phage holin family protein [Candidatus Eremiobacteraeota bacterium]